MSGPDPLPEEMEKALNRAARAIYDAIDEKESTIWENLRVLSRALLAEVRRMIQAEREYTAANYWDRNWHIGGEPHEVSIPKLGILDPPIAPNTIDFSLSPLPEEIHAVLYKRFYVTAQAQLADAARALLSECERRYARKEAPGWVHTTSPRAPTDEEVEEYLKRKIQGPNALDHTHDADAYRARPLPPPPPAPEAAPAVEPCPWCSSQAIIDRTDDGVSLFVRCLGCYAEGPMADGDAAKWNRVAHAALSGAEADDGLGSSGACGWRSMESAPRDGTQVMLFCPRWAQPIVVGRWLDGHWYAAGRREDDMGGWRPLPPPPRGEK